MLKKYITYCSILSYPLWFNLQIEPKKYSIYREEAVDAITVALESSLSDEKIREKCCHTLLVLGGHFSFSGKVMTEDWILKKAGFIDCNESELLDNEDIVPVESIPSVRFVLSWNAFFVLCDALFDSLSLSIYIYIEFVQISFESMKCVSSHVIFGTL